MARSYAILETSTAAELVERRIYVSRCGYRGEPILVTEFGGIAYLGLEEVWATVALSAVRSS